MVEEGAHVSATVSAVDWLLESDEPGIVALASRRRSARSRLHLDRRRRIGGDARVAPRQARRPLLLSEGRHARIRYTVEAARDCRRAVRYSARHDVRADPQGTTDGDLRSGCSDVSRRLLGRTVGHRGEASMRCEGAKVRGSPGARGCPDRREHLLHHDDVDGRDASHVRIGQGRARENLPDKPAPARTPASLERAVRVLVHRRNGRDDRRSQTRGVRALHQERCDGQERTALQLGGRRSQAGSLGHTTPSAAPTRSRLSRPPPPRYAQSASVQRRKCLLSTKRRTPCQQKKVCPLPTSP